jgi:thiamine-phosphate pyrophosphorylase
MKKPGRLCVITDTTIQKKFSHFEIAALAIKGGADIIQFRDKQLGTAEMITIAKLLSNLCRKKGVLFLVNDRVDVSMISGADGVHLGKDDIPVSEARKLLGKRKIIGGTAHSIKEAVEREKEGADYIGFGHIYPTYSKHKPDKPKGLKYLEEAVKAVSIPVIAIGGIDLKNITEVMKTGVHGAAMIGSVVKSRSPEKAVKEFRKRIYAV